MALRSLLLILAAAMAPAAVAQVKRYPLDDRATYLIGIGADAPTTVVFPSAIEALDAANLAATPDAEPPVLLAHTPGAAFFSVRATRPEAHAAVNVLHRGRAYALTFRAGPAVDRTVTFTERERTEPASAPRLTVARWLNVLDRAKAHRDLAHQYPALTQSITRATPLNVVVGAGFTATIEEVLRFEPEDTLVLIARLENPGREPIRYRADRLAARIGAELLPVAITDATGEIPPQSATRIHLAVTGAADGGRAGLSVHNVFGLEISLAP